jgi:hypothetical protein
MAPEQKDALWPSRKRPMSLRCWRAAVRDLCARRAVEGHRTEWLPAIAECVRKMMLMLDCFSANPAIKTETETEHGRNAVATARCVVLKKKNQHDAITNTNSDSDFFSFFLLPI